MRSRVVVVLVAGAAIAAAAPVLRAQSAVHAASSSAPHVVLGDMSQLMKDPEYRMRKRAEISAGLAESGADVASELGLTPSELRQLIDLETNFQMGVFDTFIPSHLGGPRPDPAAGRAAVEQQKELRTELHAEIIALLGASKAQQLDDYVKSQPARQQVKQLQASLLLDGTAMNADQQRSLIATISTEQERGSREVAAYRAQSKNGAAANKTFYETLSDELEIDVQTNARIVQAATPVLSPPQVSSLQTMLADPIAKRRLHMQAHMSDYEKIRAR